MKELLEATGKYDAIEVIVNAEANDLKEKIRSIVDGSSAPSELFFYYTGHGYAYNDEFFYCATNFDCGRPNESGLSTADLHTFLRLANADLVVKVVDACNSGTYLIKSDFSQQSKQGFKNLIQISSCLDTQSSLAGHPLSLFTKKFRDAALRKTEGVVHYIDLIGLLRDQFIGLEGQTPFFVQQGTGRETFVDDARKLDSLREATKRREATAEVAPPIESSVPTTLPSIAERLGMAENKLVKSKEMNEFVINFFDHLKEELSVTWFSEFFVLEILEHDDFKNLRDEQFIVDMLLKEKRIDNFVTASYSRRLRKRNVLLGLSAWYDNEASYEESYDLALNCKMPRAQLCLTLIPRFLALRRMQLVVTCAPSLDKCYVFSVVTRHFLQDFEKFDSWGTVAKRHWCKLFWGESTNDLVKKISSTLSEVITNELEAAVKQLEVGR